LGAEIRSCKARESSVNVLTRRGFAWGRIYFCVAEECLQSRASSHLQSKSAQPMEGVNFGDDVFRTSQQGVNAQESPYSTTWSLANFNPGHLLMSP
jgi:hypothetical protein